MASVVLALAASLVAGTATGVFAAARTGAGGVRPRRWLREHSIGVQQTAFAIAVLAIAVAVVFLAGETAVLAPLGATCGAAAFLMAFAAWLVLVEPDEDGEAERFVDPEWWPEFERELRAWTRRRVPVGPRS